MSPSGISRSMHARRSQNVCTSLALPQETRAQPMVLPHRIRERGRAARLDPSPPEDERMTSATRFTSVPPRALSQGAADDAPRNTAEHGPRRRCLARIRSPDRAPASGPAHPLRRSWRHHGIGAHYIRKHYEGEHEECIMGVVDAEKAIWARRCSHDTGGRNEIERLYIGRRKPPVESLPHP